MVSFQHLLKAVDNLSADELATLEHEIERRKQALSPARKSQRLQQLEGEIQQLLASAPTVELQAGTMDVEKFKAALADIREGISLSEWQSIVADMNSG